MGNERGKEKGNESGKERVKKRGKERGKAQAAKGLSSDPGRIPERQVCLPPTPQQSVCCWSGNPKGRLLTPGGSGGPDYQMMLALC